MLEEGSPKTSHRLVVALGVLGALAMFGASFGAYVEYPALGRDIQLDIGASWAMIVGLPVAVLLLAWHRGLLAGAWPLWGAAILAGGVLVFIVGDLVIAFTAERVGGVNVTTELYVTLVASLVVLIVSVIGARTPIVEESEARGQWSSRRESTVDRDSR